MRILLTGGGTGGHVNPAIAIANTVRDMLPDSEIAFVGTERGIENKLVAKEGYKMYHVEIQGLKRSLSPTNIKAAWLAAVSPLKGKKIVREFKPDVTVGTGGYVCWAAVRGASLCGVPTALHESNAVPGLAVSMLEKYVDKIYINFEETINYLKYPQKAVRVGNPIRNEFNTLSYDSAREELGIKGNYRTFILSCGGSMGAEPINNQVIDFMKSYVSKHPDILHIHATGSLEYKSALQKFNDLGLDKFHNIKLLEYIYDMPIQMAAADIVINRAGAITISELASLHKPSILIPSPYVTNNHQYKNAHVLELKNAAVLLKETELHSGAFENAVTSLIGNRSLLKQMSENIAQFAVPDATKIIFNQLFALVNSKII